MSPIIIDPQLLRALAATRTVVLFDNMRTGGSTDTGRQKLTIPMMADSTAGLIQRLKLDKPDIWRCGAGLRRTNWPCLCVGTAQLAESNVHIVCVWCTTDCCV